MVQINAMQLTLKSIWIGHGCAESSCWAQEVGSTIVLALMVNAGVNLQAAAFCRIYEIFAEDWL